MTPVEIIDRAFDAFIGHGLTREQSDVFKAMLAWSNFCLEAREDADAGDEDARVFLEEITQTRLRALTPR